MNTKDLRKKNIAELQKDLATKAKSLNDFKFGASQNKIKNVKEGKRLKKEIAQILTIVKEMKKA